MYGTSSAITSLGTFVLGITDSLTYGVPVILGVLAALLGLGWVVRKVRRYITGKKF